MTRTRTRTLGVAAAAVVSAGAVILVGASPIFGSQSAPSGVPGGSAGLADDDGGFPAPLAAPSLAGLAVAGLSVRRLAGSRA